VRIAPESRHLSIVGDVPAGVTMHLPEEEDVDWEHPGSWLCVLATPVTAAVDVVTFPLQLLFVILVAPHTH
jgi:hypothetical protein